MRNINNIVYIPIELSSRELLSRLLIARSLVKKGFVTVIGFAMAVNSGNRYWPVGNYLLKGMNKVQLRYAEQMRRQGHRVYVIDEEALGISDDWLIARDVDESIVSCVDEVFCQGNSQKLALLKHRKFRKEQLPVTGNPRVNLLTPPLRKTLEAPALSIRKEHGRFILINTNSGSINNIWGNIEIYKKILNEIGWFDPNNSDDKNLLEQSIKYDTINLNSLHEFARIMLAEHPEVPIVVRPHPSENHKTWENLLKDLSNVKIIVDTNATPWILASELVITTGCTTGLEATLLGKPAISLMVGHRKNRLFNYYMANLVNVVTESIREAVDKVWQHWIGEVDLLTENQLAREKHLQHHLFMGNQPSQENISNQIRWEKNKDGQYFPEIKIDNAHKKFLRQVTRTIHWKKGSFTEDYLKECMYDFDSSFQERTLMKISNLSWSVYKIEPEN